MQLRALHIWSVAFVSCLAAFAAIEALESYVSLWSPLFFLELPGQALWISIYWIDDDIFLKVGYPGERLIVVIASALAWSVPLTAIIVQWRARDMTRRQKLVRFGLKLVVAALSAVAGWLLLLPSLYLLNGVLWLVGKPMMHEWGFFHSGAPLVIWPLCAIALYFLAIRLTGISRVKHEASIQ